MKVIISRPQLLSLVSKVQNVVPSKPTLPIVANVLIEAIDDQVIISATDLTVSMRASCEAEVQEEGAITLPAKRLFPLLRELISPTVEIHTLSPESAVVNSGSSHFKILGMHKNEFPTFPDLAQSCSFNIAPASMKELLSRACFAAAREEGRNVFNAVLMQIANQTVTFIGTDGKRLAKIHSTIDLPQNLTRSCIIPLKTVEEMVRMLDTKVEMQARVIVMPDKIALEMPSMTLISKLLSGEFPDVSKVIPEEKEHAIALHREELMALLRQVSLFTADSSSSVRFCFFNSELHIFATHGEVGEGTVNMPVNYSGEKLEIAFNPINFLDILRHIKDETVKFNITNPYHPGLITDSSTAQFVIMPMRL